MFILLSLGIILFAVICLLSLRAGALLVVFLLPIYLVRFSVFGAPTNALDAMIFILFLVWAGGGITNYESRIMKGERTMSNIKNQISNQCQKGEMSNKKTEQQSVISASLSVIPAKAGIQSSDSQMFGNSVIENSLKIENWKLEIIFPISLLLAGCVFSVLLNDNKLKSLGLVKSWFIAPIIFFAILFSSFNTEKQRELVLSVLALSGAGIAMISLIYKILGIITYDGRLQGIFNSPNYLAMYLAPCILIILYKIIKQFSISNSQFPINNQIPNDKKKKQSVIPVPLFVIPALCPSEAFGEGGEAGIQSVNSQIFKNSIIENSLENRNWKLEIGNKKAKKACWFVSFIVVLAAFFFTFSYSAWISLFVAGLAFYIQIKSKIKSQNAKIQIKSQKYESHSEAISEAILADSRSLGWNSENLCSNGILRWPLRMTARAFKPTKKLLIVFCLLLFSFFIILYHIKNPKMADLISSKRYSIESRLMIWRSAEIILRKNPFWGIGLGNFQDEYLALAGSFEKPYLQWAAPHPHNIFLAFWLSCGLLGLAGFIWLLVLAIKKGLALLQTNPLLGILLLSILVYILLHGMADTTYFKNDLAVMFWIIISLFHTAAHHTD